MVKVINIIISSNNYFYIHSIYIYFHNSLRSAHWTLVYIHVILYVLILFISRIHICYTYTLLITILIMYNIFQNLNYWLNNNSTYSYFHNQNMNSIQWNSMKLNEIITFQSSWYIILTLSLYFICSKNSSINILLIYLKLYLNIISFRNLFQCWILYYYMYMYIILLFDDLLNSYLNSDLNNIHSEYLVIYVYVYMYIIQLL